MKAGITASIIRAATSRLLQATALTIAVSCAGHPGSASGAEFSIAPARALAAYAPAAESRPGPAVRLPGHVVALTHAAASAEAPPPALNLTLTLRRDDEAGFEQFLNELYDPQSPNFRHFLTQAQIAERFGPSQQAYDAVAAWLRAQNLVMIEGSTNRLTMTASGMRGDVEHAFGVRIGSYRIGSQTFFANDRDPALPPALATHLLAVTGLSDLARPRTLNQVVPPPNFDCPNGVDPQDCDLYGPICELYSATRATGELLQTIGSKARTKKDYLKALNTYNKDLETYFVDCLHGTFTDLNPALPPLVARPSAPATATAWKDVDGSNQTIGIVAFDNFQTYDVANYLSYSAAPASRINNLSIVNVGAGASFGAAESEVLLDIDAVMTFAPGAHVILYSSAFPGAGASFQGVFNKMLSDGLVTVISNSWAYCENQTSPADVNSIETILQSAAASGISVFSGSGDTGSTCLDGAADTIAVPADAPHITAVGGTTLNAGAGGVYKSETWWDGSTHTPPSGQGGFGVSKFFARPAYQNGLTLATMRSVPDVSAPADPVNGLMICQTDAGGCPNGLMYGGTSLAAPAWAAFTALLNQANGSNLGFVNAAFYPLSASTGFHNAASMGSDFAHVGLGSPNLDALSLALAAQSPGTPDAGLSEVLPMGPPNAQFANVPGVPADGLSAAVVVVTLRDANGNSVPGKSVTLAANPGNQATITPPSGNSSINDGTVTFTITDETAEVLTLKATDTSDSVIVTQQPTLTFVTALATGAAMDAFPLTQASDGVSTSTVTVTLKDRLNRGTPGKQVQLFQSHNSVILSANPGTTDGSGQVQFLVADQVAETEHYVATDLTDGNLSLPVSANVTFSGSSIACAAGPAPTAGPGYRIDVYASALPVQANSTYGGVNIFGCVGAGGIAFDGAGNMFVSAFVTGDMYKFPPGGGIAGAGNKLANNTGIGLAGLTYGTDGNLYGARLATTGDYTTGAVVKIDQTTGASTTVASSLVCPVNITTNPLNGDLFVSDFCGFAGANPAVLRIADPGGSPVVTGYASSEGAPNGSVSTAPDGTLYVVSNYFGQGSIDEISPTNEPQPPTVTPTGVYSTYSSVSFGSNPSGGAQALITSSVNVGGYPHSVAAFDMTASPPSYSGVTLVTADIGAIKVIGPDGCLYLTEASIIYKVSNADGSCPLAGLAPNPSVVLVPEIAPANAAQGTPVHFDVTFPHTTLPAGTPVAYSVTGANHVQGQALVGLDNRAVIIYAGVIEGVDTITAYAPINGTPVASNPVLFRWDPNKHVSQIYLDTSVASASLGSSANVSATIIDTSHVPAVPIPNLTIQFTMGGQTCSAVSNASGFASCSLTAEALTQCTLTAAFAGDATYLASSASELFSVSSYDVIFTNGFEPPLFGGGCIVYN